MTTLEVNDEQKSVSDSVSIVIAPAVATDTVFSGQITVTTAGTAVQGTSILLPNGVYVKAMTANTGASYVGNTGSGDVASTNGYELSGGEVVILQVSSLSDLWFDAATNGNKFCWVKA